MTERAVPEWFPLCDPTTEETMARISASVENTALPIQIRFAPLQAHWFILNTLLLANQANREGMHSNALALTRQCLEALSIVELGLSRDPGAADTLARWERDKASAGQVRKWLAEHVWPSYGSGLWQEPWGEFMGKLTGAIQPYAHYTTQLAKWQLRFTAARQKDGQLVALAQISPRAYDPAKATRITLYHAILTYALARIWIASRPGEDAEFAAMTSRFGKALGKSKYLDGHGTDWEQQFWAMVWTQDGDTILE